MGSGQIIYQYVLDRHVDHSVLSPSLDWALPCGFSGWLAPTSLGGAGGAGPPIAGYQ